MKTVLRVLREWLWFCAGADLSIARQVKSERVILDSIGASVFGTMLLAGLTSSYAAFFVFDDKFQAIGFGCLWAALIFNLDRYSVASIRKSGSFAQDVIVALPRMILALIIAVVIVVPLELRLFKAEIEEKLPEYAVEQLKTYVDAVEKSHLGSTVGQYEQKLKAIRGDLADREKRSIIALAGTEASGLQSALNAKREKIEELEDELEEREGKKAELERLSVEEEEGLRESQKKGKGSNWRALTAKGNEQEMLITSKHKRLENLRREQAELRKRLADIGDDDRLKQLREDQRRIEEDIEEAIKLKEKDIDSHRLRLTEARAASLLTRLSIIQKLAQQNSTADWTVTLLRLLVVVLELAPILLKLLSERGPYDVRRDTKAQLEINEAEREIDIRNS